MLRVIIDQNCRPHASGMGIKGVGIEWDRGPGVGDFASSFHVTFQGDYLGDCEPRNCFRYQCDESTAGS